MSSAKNLGTAHNGTQHWWKQRITAVALIPLIATSIILILKSIILNQDIRELFFSPFYTACLLLTLLISLYHSTLGIQEIIEDYVHKNVAKYTLLILIKFIATASALLLLLATFSLHLNSYPFDGIM